MSNGFAFSVRRGSGYNRSVTEPATIASLLLSKTLEQAELLEELISLVPRDSLDWKPARPGVIAPGAGGETSFSIGELLGHLLDCMAGLCATLYAAHPGRLSHFARLRELPVNHRCNVEEAQVRLREYAAHIEEGFALLNEATTRGRQG